MIGPPGIDGLHAAHHAVGGLHGHGAHAPFAQVLLHLGDHVDRLGHVEAFADDAHGVVNFRQMMLRKLDVHHRADDLHHVADIVVHVSDILRSLARSLIFATDARRYANRPTPRRSPLR